MYVHNCYLINLNEAAFRKIPLQLLHQRTHVTHMSWVLLSSLLFAVVFYSLAQTESVLPSWLSPQILSSLPRQWTAACWATAEFGVSLLRLPQGYDADLISHSWSPGGLTSPRTLSLRDNKCCLEFLAVFSPLFWDALRPHYVWRSLLMSTH